MSQEPKVTRFGADPTLDQEVATKAYVDNSSGGGLTFARVVKSVDQIINNSTTLIDDDELLFAANTNKAYHMIFLLLYAAAANADFKTAI